MSDSEPTVIGGRYELGELLGRGGMAEVHVAKDLRLGRTVAVKRLRTDLATDATFQARFRREAQSSASLNHPSIVSVYDTGEEWSAGDGPGRQGVAQPYIVMERVQGRTLREILREGRKILPERALEITSGVLAALDYSHRAGIIHRDIKPGNVMLNPAGEVKVMDFGIARAISDASSAMTQTAAVVGTAQYLSPEQARGETVDSRSDVYSTGCLLYELLTGRPPFIGDSPVAVAYQHVREPASPPSDLDDQLDPAVDAIVMKALAKRVEDRYQSAAAMRADIERYLAGHPVQAVAPAPVSPPPADATAYLPSATTTSSQPPVHDDTTGRTGLMIVMGILLLALVAGAVFLLPKMFDDTAADEVQVPKLIGLTVDEARLAIVDANLVVGRVEREASATVPTDEVFEQSPNRDLYVAPNTEVHIVVSTGKPEIEIPYVRDLTKQAAREQLQSLGLKVRFTPEESDEPKDIVLRTEPAPGTSVADGTTVTVFWSKGPQSVPNVVGMNQGEAERAITAAGFVPDVVLSNETTAPKGEVIQQSPASGNLPKNSVITIVVSTYVEPTQEPSPTDTPTTEPTPTPPTTAPPTTAPPTTPPTTEPPPEG